MRALIQRVSSASVSVGGEAARAIGAGLVVLLGVGEGDQPRDSDWLIEKILSLRLFPGEAAAGTPEGASLKARTGVSEFDRSVVETGGELLVVSQFTLYADVRKGRRPDFTRAAPPAAARGLYDGFVAALRARHPRVATGEFGAAMRVSIQNEGPVTLLLDSAENRPS